MKVFWFVCSESRSSIDGRGGGDPKGGKVFKRNAGRGKVGRWSKRADETAKGSV